jgi:hypothetical protein
MNPATHAIDRLSDLSQQFLSSEKTEQAPVLKTLLTELRQAITEGRHGEAAAALRQVIVPSLDYSSALSLHRIRKDLRGKAAMPASIRLAVLGGFTTTQIAGFIDLALFALGIDAEIYESDFRRVSAGDSRSNLRSPRVSPSSRVARSQPPRHRPSADGWESRERSGVLR